MNPHNSHHHLLAFAALALAVTMVFSSRVGAEEMMGPPPNQPKQMNSDRPENNNFGDQKAGQKDFGNNQNNRPNEFNPDKMDQGSGKPMNDNFGRPEFGNEKNEKFDQMKNNPMNNRPMNNFGEDNPGKKQFDTNDMMNSREQEDGNRDEDQDDQDDQNDQDEQRDRQMVQSAQQQIKNIEQQLRQFDKKVIAITKQKMTVPSEIAESLANVKSIIAGVKNAKTADDLEAAGWDDIRDEMSTLFESQRLLEQLAQWPKMLKQIDKQISTSVKDLRKYKSLADKLKKKEVDVSSTYAELETAVNSLKPIRDEAVAKVAAGEIEEAFDIIEDKLRDGSEIIKENQMILQTMSNVGRFTSDFKKTQKDFGRTISNLKRQKISTTDLERIETDINHKGQGVRQLITARPIDMDAIMDALEELSDLRQEFFDKVQSLGEGSNQSNFGGNQMGQFMPN